VLLQGGPPAQHHRHGDLAAVADALLEFVEQLKRGGRAQRLLAPPAGGQADRRPQPLALAERVVGEVLEPAVTELAALREQLLEHREHVGAGAREDPSDERVVLHRHGTILPMSAYTIKNLREDIDDSAAKFGMGDVLESHFARDDLDATQFGLSLQQFKPNARMPFGHQHETQEEVYVIVGGSGRIKLDDEIVDVRRWDAVRVAPEVMRAFEAGPDGLDVIAFGARSSGVRDVTQQMGWWAETE
jgi:mannose-6-phosphate isomerase-like protein (cupin superfamily)